MDSSQAPCHGRGSLIVTSRCRIPAEHTHHVAHCRSLLGQAPRRTPSVLIVLVYGRRVDTGMLSAIFPSILVLRVSVKWRGSRCDLQRRAISWPRHDMKFPLYRLATLWQSALTTRGNSLAHRHDAGRATCLKRFAPWSREEAGAVENFLNGAAHSCPALVTCGPVGSKT